jgi:hypothetical protein
MVWFVREPEWGPVNSVPVPVSPHALPPLPPFPHPPPPAQTLQVQTWLNAESNRITDQTVSRDHGVLSPLIGVMQAPGMSLMEAAVAVPHMDASAYIAIEIWSEISRNDPYGLTTDEADSLIL